jgi:acetate kinase
MATSDPRPVLILNTGSSTFKWALLSDDEQFVGTGSEEWEAEDALTRKAQIEARLRGIPPCKAVGHRIVHGGLAFEDSVVVDDAVRRELENLLTLDLLHMRPALCALDAAREAFPQALHVAAFDTAFHRTLSKAAAGYALPTEWTQRWGLRRFGFHGLSVQWSVDWARRNLQPFPRRLVVAHLGSGCSVTAVLDGRSVDTSMGFTPLEGLMMGTRAGSVDPGLLIHLLTHLGVTALELEDVLTNRSGLLGVSGVSADLREVLAAADAGNSNAWLAYDRFIFCARRAVGAAAGVLGGIDALVFTGGIGEHNARARHDICAAFEGLELDSRTAADEGVISSRRSRVSAVVVKAREDLVLLREVQRLSRVRVT